MGVMKPYRYISKRDIEAKARDILWRMELEPKYKPQWPLDASRVAEFLGLDVVWDSIPTDNLGMIAARILPLDKLIEINEEIPQLRGGFGESTIAHEIGHWVLHIDPMGCDRLLKLRNKGVYIKVEPLLCRSEQQEKGIEWQAQYFATCLLMPEYILQKITKGKNLTKWRDLYNVSEELGVTISNLLHRLKDLGWIDIQQKDHTTLMDVWPLNTCSTATILLKQ